ncbi:MAG TPA: helix-turn-helix domain-containing protein [Candidatus Thermoplasmatota archaeon]|nr:helix-turn-helix domain-containing protein [Candidatus Thermoplasmatota archaeon]
MQDVLDLETRRKIYDIISKNPGLHLSKIADLLSMRISHVEYHVNFLEKHEIITIEKSTGYKRFYLKKFYKEIYDPYYTPWKKNIWDGNYWSRSRILPQPIFGSFRISGREFSFNDLPIPIDCVNFDWHPAQEPYDITGMR